VGVCLCVCVGGWGGGCCVCVCVGGAEGKQPLRLAGVEEATEAAATDSKRHGRTTDTAAAHMTVIVVWGSG